MESFIRGLDELSWMPMGLAKSSRGNGKSAFVGTLGNATTTSSPAYNLVTISENKFEIQLAVPGYLMNDLSIELEKNILTVSGNPLRDKETFYHKGFSIEKFSMKFRIAEGIIVRPASLDSGILFISLERVVPEAEKPVKININSVG